MPWVFSFVHIVNTIVKDVALLISEIEVAVVKYEDEIVFDIFPPPGHLWRPGRWYVAASMTEDEILSFLQQYLMTSDVNSED